MKIKTETLEAARAGAARSNSPDLYGFTIDSIEPDITPIDAGAFYASAAISLKRIADVLDTPNPTEEDLEKIGEIIASRLGVTNGHIIGEQIVRLLDQAGYKIIRK